MIVLVRDLALPRRISEVQEVVMIRDVIGKTHVAAKSSFLAPGISG